MFKNFKTPLKHSKALLCLLSAILLLSACNTPASSVAISTPPSSSTPPPATTKSSFVIGAATDIQYLVPFRSTDTRSSQVIYLISEGLVRYTGNYEIEPCLATDYKINEEGTVWTFTLREGVTFHDGSPFTSADVKFTYESLLDPEQQSNQRKEYAFIDTIDTPDDLTVVFNLKYPYGPALNRFTMAILSKTYVQANGFDKNGYTGYNTVAVGTGPFKMVEWKPDIAVYLAANEEYWGKVPEIKNVEIRPILDNSVRLAAFEKGEIDFIFGVVPDEVDRIMADTENFISFNYPALGYSYMTWNNRLELFQDPNFRQALSYATNKDDIINHVLAGHAVKATTPYPPNHAFYYEVGEPYSFNPQKAIETLENAGYVKDDDGIYVSPAGIKCAFETKISSSSAINADIAVLLQAWFKDIGVDLKITAETLDQIYDAMDAVIAGTADESHYTSMIGAMSGGADPDLMRTFHTEGGLNDFRYTNPEIDELLDQGVRTVDPEARRAIYNQVQQILADDLPCLFLYFSETNNAVQNKYEGMDATAYGQIYNLRNVTVKK